jgi:hypothetical protein
MNLDLPPDARVQIVILPPAAQPLPNTPMTRPAPEPPSRPRHPLLTGAAVLTLVGCAYVFGQHATAPVGTARPSDALASRDAPALPRPATTPSPTPQDAEVPPAFRAQLRQPASVTPAPGAQPAPGGQDPFGLQD